MSKVVNFPKRDNGWSAGDMEAPSARWIASIEYRSKEGGELRTHHFEELADLETIVERGPHWDTIVKISVTLNRSIARPQPRD